MSIRILFLKLKKYKTKREINNKIKYDTFADRNCHRRERERKKNSRPNNFVECAR